MPEQTPGGLKVRLHHAFQRGGDPGPFCLVLHIGRKQGAGADGLGQHESIARDQAAFMQDMLPVNQAVHGKAQGQLLTFAGMPADQRRTRLVQHLECALQHLRKQLFYLLFTRVGNSHDSQCRLRFRSHRV